MGTMTPPPGHPLPPGTSPVGAPAVSRSRWRLVLFGLAALAAFAWLQRPAPLPDLPLPEATAEGAVGDTTSPVVCTGEKGCLVVYVAPWCGPCNASLPGDVALADHIAGMGYETVFVVGMDKEPACIAMARKLGRPARLDADGRWAKAAQVRGVPHFLVTTPGGRVVKRQAGAYMGPVDKVAELLGIS